MSLSRVRDVYRVRMYVAARTNDSVPSERESTLYMS